ncbi:MAG TPA: hypothetical protein PLY93_11715 [Turneriella sp.]|nr:hypothetical protein [Turneriella sp.]
MRRFARGVCIPFLFIFFPLHGYLSNDDVTLEKAFENKTANQLFLKYQRTDGDYLVFYDLDGSILFLRYRVDKWDYANDNTRDALRRGITYHVFLKDFQRLAENELPKGVTGAGLSKAIQKRKIRRIREVYSGALVDIKPSALRDLRY